MRLGPSTPSHLTASTHEARACISPDADCIRLFSRDVYFTLVQRVTTRYCKERAKANKSRTQEVRGFSSSYYVVIPDQEIPISISVFGANNAKYKSPRFR